MVEFFLILGAIVIYFAPFLVAAWVRHPKLAYIGGLNAALGVTGIGWVGALVWALRRRKVVAMSYHGDMQMPRSFNTGLLAAAGLIVGVAIVATIGVNRLQVPNPQATAALYAADAVVAPQWRHANAGGIETASLQSTNTLAPPAPFKSGPASLSVSQGAAGPVVRLDLDGELACSYAPAGNTLLVSFDDGPAQAFACAPAPAGAPAKLFDGDHSTAYLADPAAFLARLRAARHIAVTAYFADSSEPQPMRFDLPAGEPLPAVVAAAPAIAEASRPPAAAGAAAADDGQAAENGHGHRRRHRHHIRHEAATYVDGVPERRGQHRRHHAGA